VTIELDGVPLDALEGESLAAAMLAGGRSVFRITAGGRPRGPLCNMGVCFDCVVEVDGVGQVRACMTAVRPGLRVRTGGSEVDPEGGPGGGD
jgi:predicted molibdopterin-dependent oxidoreductase YjgC